MSKWHMHKILKHYKVIHYVIGDCVFADTPGLGKEVAFNQFDISDVSRKELMEYLKH